MREFFTYGSVRGAARKGRSLPRLTEISVRGQWFRNQRADTMSGDARRTERFPCVLFATVGKPISDFRLLVSGLCAMLFALCQSAEAQQPAKIPRIGYLSITDAATDSARAEGLRLAMRALVYIEGQNIAIEYRYAEGKVDRAPEHAAEFVRLKVDIIVVAA